MNPLPKAPSNRSHVQQRRDLSMLLPVLGAILSMTSTAWAAGTTEISNQPLATLSITAPPNLLFILDNSGSMAWEHMPDDMNNYKGYGYVSAQCNGTAYDPMGTYDPPKKYDGTSYPNVSFSAAPLDGYSGTAKLNLGDSTLAYTAAYNNGTKGITNPFYHYYTYKGSEKPMAWVYTAAGVTKNNFYNECTADIGSSTGSGVFTEVKMTSASPDAQKYANWFSYYRKRYLLMRTAVGKAVNGMDATYNVGFNAINDSNGNGNTVASDGKYFRDVKPFDASTGTSSQKANFYTSLYGISPSGSTPLRGALAKAGQYFANQASSQGYDPMQYACQRNYALLTTDGYWNSENNGGGPYALDRTTLVGNQDGDEIKPMWDGTSVTKTTVVTHTAPATRTETAAKTITTPWTRTKTTSATNNTGTAGNPKYKTTIQPQSANETLKQSCTTPQAATATYTVTTVVTNGTIASGYPQTSATSYSAWVGTASATCTTVSDTGAPPATGSFANSGTATTGTSTTPGTTTTTTPVKGVSTTATTSTTDSTAVTGTDTAGTPAVSSSTSGGSSDTLADVAEYYYKTDLRNTSLGNCKSSSSGAQQDVCQDDVPQDTSSGDLEKFQHMNTFTIGLGVNGTLAFDSGVTPISGTTINWPKPCGSTGSSCGSNGDATNVDDLWHAALNGRGQYYSALSATALSTAIKGVLDIVGETPGAGSSASTSSLELVSGGNNQVFKASYTTSTWTGDLQAFTLDSATASISGTALWSAQSLLDATASTSRKIFFNSGGTLTPFTYAKLTSAGKNAYFDNFCTQSVVPSQCAALKAESTASDLNLANNGTNLVNYLAGARSYESVVATASGGVSATTLALYRKRTHVLGDIINGAPVYVGKPPFSYADSGYADFAAAKASRQPVAYTAANDGMLHAFSAATDGSGGKELWAYVPTMVLPNLYRLADANYSVSHQYYVDGAPVMGDVYMGGQWKTILVGGLNDGGQGYYALDITDPTNPVLLWEFTDSNLGASYGNPIITKRSDGTWVVAFSSGYNNVTGGGDGNGHLYVVNAATGVSVLKNASGISVASIATGSGASAAGSTTTPSGLAKINAWIDDATNNTSLRFYGGDMLGNLWRFDVDGLVAPTHDALLLAHFEANNVAQPITTRPETVSVGTRAVVVVSTGRYMGSDDISNTDQQSVYAVADNLTATGWGDPRSTANAAAFVKQTFTVNGTSATITDKSVDFSDPSIGGWYVDLPHTGERVFANMSTQLNTLVITTAIPNGNACSSGGASWVYYLDVTNGGVVVTNTPAGAQFSDVALIVGTSWVKDSDGNLRIIFQNSKGDVTEQEPPVSSSPNVPNAHRTSWRELTN